MPFAEYMSVSLVRLYRERSLEWLGIRLSMDSIVGVVYFAPVCIGSQCAALILYWCSSSAFLITEWSVFANMHPFAPTREQANWIIRYAYRSVLTNSIYKSGYADMIVFISQPNSCYADSVRRHSLSLTGERLIPNYPLANIMRDQYGWASIRSIDIA